MKRGEAAEAMHIARDFRREHGLRNGKVAAVSTTLIKSGEVLAQFVEEQGTAESEEIETLQDVLRGASADFEPLDRIQEIEDEWGVPLVVERAQPPRDNRETALDALDVEVARMLEGPPGEWREAEPEDFLANKYPSDLDSEMSDQERGIIDHTPQNIIDDMTARVEPWFSAAVGDRHFPDELLPMLQPFPGDSAPQADTATPDDSQCVPAPSGTRFTDGTTALRSAEQLAVLMIPGLGF